MGKKEFILPEDQLQYNPSPAEAIIVSRIFNEFLNLRSERDTGYRYFGRSVSGSNRTLSQYIDMSEKRWNSQGINVSELESWQARVFKPETRKKIITTVARVAQQLPRERFTGPEGLDNERSLILQNIYKSVSRRIDDDHLDFNTILEAVIKGTSIRFEGFADNSRTIREVIDMQGEDVTFKTKKIKEGSIESIVVPLEDFYPESVRFSTISKMNKCVWRSVLPFDVVKQQWGDFSNFKYVRPGGDITKDTYFGDVVSSDIVGNNNLVEVIRYFNKQRDEFIILLNGVWINPLKTWQVMPLPWSHKTLPFWSIIFEPISASSDFLYGKSLADKIQPEQDALNAFINMVLDQGLLSIHKPMLVGEADSMEDIHLVPGRLEYVGASLKEFKELDISPPSSAHFQILGLLQGSIEESTSAAIEQGQIGSGSTATEILHSRESAGRIAQLFSKFIVWGLRDKARLRIKNILQFVVPLPARVEQILGEGGAQKIVNHFQTFRVDNVRLTKGTIGTQVIQIVPSKKNLPTKQELETEAQIKGIEKIVFTPEYIRDIEVDVEMEAVPEIELSEGLKIALSSQFSRDMLEMFPDKIDRTKLFNEHVRAWRKDPVEISLNPGELPQMQPADQKGKPSAQGQIGATRTVNNQIMQQGIPEMQLPQRPDVQSLFNK